MVSKTETIDLNNNHAYMALLHEEDDHNHEDKRSNKVQRTDIHRN